MTTRIKTLAALLLTALIILALSGCGKSASAGSDPWADALYTEDTELGEGEKSFTLKVTAEDKAVLFTVHTDENTVGEALQTLGLIDGEEGPYGLYIKLVNGITADYDADGSYWAFYIDGEQAMTGADMTEVTEGAEYGLAKQK